MSCERERGQSLRDLFHLVGKVLPEIQELVTFSPKKTVFEAVRLMRKKNFGQVPVLEGNVVLGVFSYRSLAKRLLELPEKELRKLPELTVDEFTEDLRFAHVTDKLTELLDEFELMDAVLVGQRNRLQGIITTIDALVYFYQVASPYIIIRTIELAIRELIRNSVNENELEECANKSIKEHYENLKQSVPSQLEEMSLNDYIMILRRKDTWEKFSPAFGQNSNLVYARLKPLPELRNDIFHFMREIAVEDYELLRDARDWLLKRITILEERRKVKRDE